MDVGLRALPYQCWVSHNNKIVGRVKGTQSYFLSRCVFYFKYFPKWLYKSSEKIALLEPYSYYFIKSDVQSW